MSGPSESTKQGQQASTTRTRAALQNQEARRSRRPLEGQTPSPRRRATAGTGQPATDVPNLDLPTVRQTPVHEDQAPDIDGLLKRYGITTVPNVIYEWGGYRYSNPTDAIAAAKRGTTS